MKRFQGDQEIWSRQESVTNKQMDRQTDGQMNGQTDEGHAYNPLSILLQGIVLK